MNGSDLIKLTGLGFTTIADFGTNLTITFTGDVTGQLDNSDFIF